MCCREKTEKFHWKNSTVEVNFITKIPIRRHYWYTRSAFFLRCDKGLRPTFCHCRIRNYRAHRRRHVLKVWSLPRTSWERATYTSSVDEAQISGQYHDFWDSCERYSCWLRGTVVERRSITGKLSLS